MFTLILHFIGFDEAIRNVRTELMAGFSTFLTMSYILAVNPLILGDAGMDKGTVFFVLKYVAPLF